MKKGPSMKLGHMSAFGRCAGQCRDLILPEAFEAIRSPSRVTDGRVDRLVPKVVLDCPGVLAVVCELVAAGMPQHVGCERGSGSPRPRQPARPCADRRQR